MCLEARAFNFTYRYIDEVLSINNSRFAEFLPLIYPPELEETTDTASSASFLDIYLEFEDSDQLSTKIYDKRDDFNFKNHKFSKYVQQYTSFSCIWCLHLAIDSLCKGQKQLFWFPETSSSSEKQATGPGLLKDSPYSIS